MEKNSAIAAMKIAQKPHTQEALGQRKWYKFKNWYQTKALPVLKNALASVGKAIKNMPGLNWGAVLVMVVLAHMAKNGIMEDMPNIKWLVESTVRLIDWCFGLIRGLFEWVVGTAESELFSITDIFGILEMLTNWMKEIFAL